MSKIDKIVSLIFNAQNEQEFAKAFTLATNYFAKKPNPSAPATVRKAENIASIFDSVLVQFSRQSGAEQRIEVLTQAVLSFVKENQVFGHAAMTGFVRASKNIGDTSLSYFVGTKSKAISGAIIAGATIRGETGIASQPSMK